MDVSETSTCEKQSKGEVTRVNKLTKSIFNCEPLHKSSYCSLLLEQIQKCTYKMFSKPLS
jgi:hypothetical protein